MADVRLLRVGDDGVRTERQLSRWVTLGSDYARKLPPKITY